MTTKFFQAWKRRVNRLKIMAYTIFLLYKDPRVPWYAKILIVCVIAYAFSPIDKFLNSIPIIGYLDHLVLVPIGVALAFKKMIPPAVLTDCRKKAGTALNRNNPTWVDGSIIIFMWFLFASLAIVTTIWIMKDWNRVLIWWCKWFMRMTKFRNHMPGHVGV